MMPSQFSNLALRKQAGVTLLEMLISIGILGSVVAGLATLIGNASEDTRASVTALHVKTVGDAANAYIKDNYASITTVATAASPALIRVSDLIAQGYLPTGYSAANPRRQSTCVLVLEPTPNKLTGLVVTEGGDTIDDLTLGQVAGMVGGSGAGIYSTSPGVISGAMGGFSFPFGAFGNPNQLGQRCDGTAGAPAAAAGHVAMALWYSDGAQSGSTLYRDAVPGNPSLNTMNTPILMGASTVQIEGQSCPENGALGRTASGAVLSCTSGAWKSSGSQFWQDPVANLTGLPACNAASLYQTRIVKSPSVGSVPRAYTCGPSSLWIALSVDDAGNLDVPNRITSAATTVTGTATINKLGGTLEITSVEVVNSACSVTGRMARTASGQLVSCQGGVWTAPAAAGGSIMYGYAAASTLCASIGKSAVANARLGAYGYSYVWWGDANGSPTIAFCV